MWVANSAAFGGRVEDFAPPFAPKPDGRHKGDGNVSDDTLMVLALCRAYLAKGGQLDAHDAEPVTRQFRADRG